MDKNQINIDVLAKDLATKILKDINHEIKETGKVATQTGDQGGASFLKLSSAFAVGQLAANLLSKGISFVAETIVDATNKAMDFAKAFISNGVQVAAQLETNEKGFIVLVGSAEKARKIMARIKMEAARTPFEIPGLTTATQLLTSVTKDGDKAIDIILDVGESLAAMGKGQAELDRISVNLQQIGAVGKASMMDIKQFAFAGIPIFDMLKKETKLTGEKLEDFISDGGVTFNLLTKMFDKATKKGGQFFGAFKTQSGTFNQLMSNMGDGINIFAADFVQTSGIFDLAKAAVDGFNKVLAFVAPILERIFSLFREGLTEKFSEMGIVFGRIKDTLGPLIPDLNAGGDAMNTMDSAASLLGVRLGDLVVNALIAVNSFLQGFKENSGPVIEALGALKEAFFGAMDTASVSTEDAKNKVDGFSKELGGKFANTVKVAILFITDFFNQVKDPNSDLRKFASSIITVGKSLLTFIADIGNAKKQVDGFLNGIVNFWNGLPGPIKQILKGALSGGIVPMMEAASDISKGKDIGTILKNIGGFSNGADFVVPPGFPNDSFPMKVESGEHVQVTPKNQSGSGNKSMVFNNYFSSSVNTEQVASTLAFQIGGI